MVGRRERRGRTERKRYVKMDADSLRVDGLVFRYNAQIGMYVERHFSPFFIFIFKIRLLAYKRFFFFLFSFSFH